MRDDHLGERFLSNTQCNMPTVNGQIKGEEWSKQIENYSRDSKKRANWQIPSSTPQWTLSPDDHTY